MKVRAIALLAIQILFIYISSKAVADIQISRSRKHEDKTGKLIPLVTSFSTLDVKQKIKGADLIFVVDDSGSMIGDRIELVKESLKYMVGLMNEQDNIALVKFDTRVTLLNGLTQMTEGNKKSIINNINNKLNDYGGTNIYLGLQKGLDQITKDYSNGDRICSIVLLSDGVDQGKNADTNFKNYILSKGKNNYIFTLHTLGYGNNHDAILMKNLAAVRDGGYFFIEKLTDVYDAFLHIYGSLSTNYEVNINLELQSNFIIDKVFGMEEMYNATLTNKNPYIFDVNILHTKYGKTYSFVSLVDVPDDTPYGTEILRARVSCLNKTAYFYWDKIYQPNDEEFSDSYDSFAYEEYIKAISAAIFTNAFDIGKTNINKAIETMKNEIIWLEQNYIGIGVFDWKTEYENVIKDLQNFTKTGKANLLSKIRELKSQNIGSHYSTKNSYENSLIEDLYGLEVQNTTINNITDEKTITTEDNKNYYYFYLKEGVSKINGTHFSGQHSTLIIYTENKEEINIKALSDYFEYYTWSQKKIRIQTQIDMGRGGNFIIKRDFPFDFYSYIDGNFDILFNIQILKLEYKEMPEEPQHLFEIKAFIIDEKQIEALSKQTTNTLPKVTIYNGYYDKGFRVGKILLKKEEISKHLNSNSISHFYLYVVIQKVANSNVIYTNVEGQFSFVKMNYISNHIPEGFYIFNDLSVGQKFPHTYALKMEPNLGKNVRIEFASSGNELDCKILKYDNYDKGSEDVYSDYEEFNIQREFHMGKTYIYITQSNIEKNKFDDIIISVFSNNPGHTAGTETTKLAYTLRYTSYTYYGLYNYNDINEKNGEVIIKQDEGYKNKFKIIFYPLKYQKFGENYNKENTRFFLRVYILEKSRQKIYDSISLFENDVPVIFKEVNNNNNNELSLDFEVDLKINYFLTLYTISKETNEILSYSNKKIYRTPIDVIIDDYNSFENEYNKELNFNFQVANNIVKKNLIIQILEFDDAEPSVMQASIGDNLYQFDPSNNIITIPKKNCSGKTVHLEINVKFGTLIEYYLIIKMTDQNYEIIPSQINMLSYINQQILQPDSEYPKVYTLRNGDVLAISSVIGVQQTKIGKLNNEGRIIYGDSTLSRGYSPDAQLVQPSNSDFYLISYHNKQNLVGQESKQNILTFKDKNIIIDEINTKNSIYQKTSVIALKNGNIIIAGLNYIATFGEETKVEVNIYNPKTGSKGQGISFSATSKYISCYEQKENNIYCVYVSFETLFVSKLRIKHITVFGNTLTNSGDEVIKTLYTEFNFLKAIPFNDEESLILFQVGNGKKSRSYENNGKDLYFYHLRIENSANFELSVLRYEYLYNNCLYDKDNHNPEYYNADISVLSKHRIYAVCETQLNKFKGFIIYPEKKEIDEFYFNNFNAENVKTPVFARFDKTLGIFYTHINENLNSRIAYQLMNYPDCVDFRDSPILIPKGFFREFDFMGKVFLSNPYPANRKEIIKVRFKSYSNISIINPINNAILVPDTDYHSTFSLQFKPNGIQGIYNIKYTSTRRDSLDGLIIGKTCKITFNTPECLEQCESCTEKGTKEHHMCLGCKEGGPYYEEEDPTTINEGYGKPHFCKKCNISCSSCHGPFLNKLLTTNCKKCDYYNNYFHYEFDERTCISNETKEYWQDVIGIAIYLDTTPGPDKKEEWRWRHCHENCAECFEKGDNYNNKCYKCKQNYYFFCNQTIGNGIPGSCYTGCKNNGFYIKIDEEREKCCPCLNHCKECKDDEKCDKCYPPFFKTENGTLCNESCGYCLAEDRYLWECVNCKTKYKTPKYTLNNTCVDEIPFIESIKRYHHIIDDKCNLLHGCKEGCYKCDPWYSDSCTECNSSYYKEDFYNKTNKPRTFHCFNETTCKGVSPYKHNEKLRIGGVPLLENGENVCLNCKLRNNSYRLPEDNYYCGDKIKRTYIDIEDYNKLSYCYLRCKECDYWGNACVMNCSSCRDGNYYKPSVKIGNYYNCYRKPHKCGIYPYYHDYDLSESLGKDEDNCGEDCDVCLYNFSCTETFPYFIVETHECVEYCPFTDIFGGKCNINNTRAGILLLQNPLGLKDPYDFLNTSVTLNQVISSSFFEYIAKSYNIEVNSLKNEINNHLGNGQIYNLPESQIIIGNNITIELSSVKLELEKLANLFKNDETTKKNTSIIDLSSCQEILKKKYGLSSEEDLMIIKGDLLQQLSEQYLSNQVEYQLFSTSLGAFLPLNDCKEAGTSVTVTNPFNSSFLLGEMQFKLKNAFDEGYNIFDSNNAFYNDICTPFTNENGNDVLLDERRKNYFNENYNLCEKGCNFIGYNETIKIYTCNCSVKSSINDESNYEVIPMDIPDDFFNKTSQYSNIKVFKCASQVFSLKGQKMNIGSYILFSFFIGFVVSIIVFFSCNIAKMNDLFSNLSKIPNNLPANPPKPVDIKEGYDDFVEKLPENPKNIQKDFVLSEDDLNLSNYDEAKVNDKRSFFKYYWSLLKLKQLFIFTFYTYTDHNLRIVKIIIFILFLSFYFSFTALFFNDNIMRAIYNYKGNTDAAVHITNIILSSICCLIMNLIIRFIVLSERDIHKIMSEKNPDNRKSLAEKTRRILKIKLIMLFIISGLLIALCWYYVAAFCAVFKNSQFHYFINVFISFIICNLWPFVTSLIAPCFRILSLRDEKDRRCMYKFSQFISYL